MNVNLKFGAYQSSSTLENFGTLKALLGDKGSFSITASSVKGKPKDNGELTRVYLILDKGDGNGTTILTCSKSVSEGLRNKQIAPKDLMHYEIVQDAETQVPFLSTPANTGNVFTVKAEEAAKEAPAPKAVKWEELVAF